MSFRLASLLDSAESAVDSTAKIEALQKIHVVLPGERTKQFAVDENITSTFCANFPRFLRLQSDENTMVRCLVSEILVDIGSMYLEFTPKIFPVLVSALKDDTPAVVRQAIRSGVRLFKHTLVKIAIQGRFSSELNHLLLSSWDSMLKLKYRLFKLAFQPSSSGVNLLALKCMEDIIHLFTHDGSSTSEPPLEEGGPLEFNISWIRGGHHILNAANLSVEASKLLGTLLDQLRPPKLRSLSNLVIILITKSLATIAKTRPSYYGRILPVLLGMNTSDFMINGAHAYGARLALKNAFITCLNCTHPSSAPWRDRLTQALKDFNLGNLADDYMYAERNTLAIKEEVKGDSMDSAVEKQMSSLGDRVKPIFGTKRRGIEDDVMSNEVDSLPSKRSRSMSNSDDATKEHGLSSTVIKDETIGCADSSNPDDSLPVQQLVAMFGALVAQGEKAVGSLEILISTISVDLLAEVVMANMRHLGSQQQYFDSDDVPLVNMTISGSDNNAKYPQSFLEDVLALSSSFPAVARQLLAHNESSFEDQHQPLDVAGNIHGPTVDLPAYASAKHVHLSGLSHSVDTENLDGDIPGIVSFACNEASSEMTRNSTLLHDEMEQFASINSRSSLEFLPCVSVERCGENNPKEVVTEASGLVPSIEAPIESSRAVTLPKISAPVLYLDDVQKDQLQILAFVRIIDAYKYIALAGGSQIRFSLLACLGVEFPSDIDPWKLLQTHIISDYVVFEGHELTLRVLYRLFREVEEDRDLFSSTSAATVYETFLMAVVETLKLSFPPSDKSLSKLLCEAPYLPPSVFSFLESLCYPENNEQSNDSKTGDRVTQGLSTVWNLVMQRPPVREPCLKIALKSASHHSEEVRMKAIRLVANKLFPLASLSRQIEDFARDSLLTAAGTDANIDIASSVNFESQKNEANETSTNSCNKDEGSMELAVAILDAQRCTSLYFALCTKRHNLLHDIFLVYKSASTALKEAVHIHIPILVRTIGSGPELLEILSDPPPGSEDLVTEVVKSLTEAAVPSPELIGTIIKLYDTKMMLPDILILILPFLSREEIFLKFSKLVILPPVKFKKAVAQILQGSPHSGPVMAPAEVLIAIHGVDPERDGVPLKRVTDACNSCFEQPQIFTQQVLATALNQLVEQIPLPLLFMRTVLQSIGAYPALVDFVMEILSRLVTKQIWKYPKLWVGFLRCAILTKPRSFTVLLQLPPPQLENALHRNPDLKPLLEAHASQPHIKSSLPRSVLAVIGISLERTESSVVDVSNQNNEN